MPSTRIPFSPPSSFALPDVAMSDLAVFTVNGRVGMPRTLLLDVSQEFLVPLFRPRSLFWARPRQLNWVGVARVYHGECVLAKRERPCDM